MVPLQNFSEPQLPQNNGGANGQGNCGHCYAALEWHLVFLKAWSIGLPQANLENTKRMRVLPSPFSSNCRSVANPVT